MKNIPPQMGVDAAVVLETVESSSYILDVVVYGNLFLQLISSAAAQQLWGLINTSQLIVLIPLFDLYMPGNIISVMKGLIKVVMFDLIPVQSWLEGWMDL